MPSLRLDGSYAIRTELTRRSIGSIPQFNSFNFRSPMIPNSQDHLASASTLLDGDNCT